MQLIRAQVTNFRSIEDSLEFDIGGLTCLVGKNEAGKTGLLLALYGLFPFGAFAYDKTRDYPRRFLAKFDERHPNGISPIAKTWWKLEQNELNAIRAEFGAQTLSSDAVTITRSIGSKGNTTWAFDINERACLDHLIDQHGLDAIERNSVSTASNSQEAAKTLEALPQRSQKLTALLEKIKEFRKNSAYLAIIDAINNPSFFYTSHFDRMSGEISLNQLASDRQNNKVSSGDKIFLDFLEYAGTTVEELQKATRYEELKAKLEAASNDITEEIFQFWSQNDALEVKIDIGEGKSGDPAPFNSGTVIKIRIENRNHRATVPLSERSAGFVWFFSFLAQFKQLKKTAGNAILLLDEPGLTLHGKAQADLLRYIEERLLPEHQVIYTTHSPFMVPANRMDTVRIVEDVVTKDERGRPMVQGTKVSKDVLRVDKDTLFPLQGALGYEITQSLFVGKNTLLVEGPSDILYLQVVSEALRRSRRTSLDVRWTLCPSGGIDKISPFVSLFGGNKLNIAVLCDLAHGDKAKLDRLKKSQILNAGQLYTVADFTGKAESDVEDLIHPALYARMLNNAFDLPPALRLTEPTLLAADASIRLVKKAEAAFRMMGTGAREFDHYAPAEFLVRNPMQLDGTDPEVAATLDNFEPVFFALNKCLTRT